jgi:hypothetical protein
MMSDGRIHLETKASPAGPRIGGHHELSCELPVRVNECKAGQRMAGQGMRWDG